MFLNNRASLALLVVLALSALVAAPDVAMAQGDEAGATADDDKFFELVDKAQADFSSGAYDAALESYMAAYELKSDPTLLFNIGFTHEKLGNLEEAKRYYLEFIDAPGVDLGARQSASKRVSVIREILKEKDAPADTTPPADGKTDGGAVADTTPPTNTDDPDSAGDGADKTDGEDVVVAPDPVEKVPREPVSTFTIISLAAGGAMLAGGGATWFLAERSRLQISSGATAEERRTARDKALLMARVGDGLVATGAVLGVVGVIGLVRRGPAAETSPESAGRGGLLVSPVVTSGGAGLSIDFRF